MIDGDRVVTTQGLRDRVRVTWGLTEGARVRVTQGKVGARVTKGLMDGDRVMTTRGLRARVRVAQTRLLPRRRH